MPVAVAVEQTEQFPQIVLAHVHHQQRRKSQSVDRMDTFTLACVK